METMENGPWESNVAPTNATPSNKALLRDYLSIGVIWGGGKRLDAAHDWKGTYTGSPSVPSESRG